MGRRCLNPGDRVIVNITGYDPGDTITPKLAKKYNGKTMTVARKRTIKSNFKSYFELEGAVSEKGFPWCFCDHWLKEATEDVD